MPRAGRCRFSLVWSIPSIISESSTSGVKRPMVLLRWYPWRHTRSNWRCSVNWELRVARSLRFAWNFELLLKYISAVKIVVIPVRVWSSVKHKSNISPRLGFLSRTHFVPSIILARPFEHSIPNTVYRLRNVGHQEGTLQKSFWPIYPDVSEKMSHRLVQTIWMKHLPQVQAFHSLDTPHRLDEGVRRDSSWAPSNGATLVPSNVMLISSRSNSNPQYRPHFPSLRGLWSMFEYNLGRRLWLRSPSGRIRCRWNVSSEVFHGIQHTVLWTAAATQLPPFGSY